MRMRSVSCLLIVNVDAFQLSQHLHIFKRHNLVVKFNRTKVINTDIVDDSKKPCHFLQKYVFQEHGMEMEPGTTQPT